MLMLAMGLLMTGAIAGVLAGLLGVGGGIIIVPVLFYLFGALGIPTDIAMPVAVATSLATIIPTSISSARAHHARGALDMDVFRSWAPSIFCGAALGGLASTVFDGAQLTTLFGAVALVVAINMASPKALVVARGLPTSHALKAMIGSVIGFLSALMGVGGGTLAVPVLTVFSFPVRRAVGTASAFGFVIAVPAVVGFVVSGWNASGRPPFSFGYLNVPAAALIFSATILTAPFGARIAHTINPRVLKLAFSGFLFLTSVQMLSGLL